MGRKEELNLALKRARWRQANGIENCRMCSHSHLVSDSKGDELGCRFFRMYISTPNRSVCDHFKMDSNMFRGLYSGGTGE